MALWFAPTDRRVCEIGRSVHVLQITRQNLVYGTLWRPLGSYTGGPHLERPSSSVPMGVDTSKVVVSDRLLTSQFRNEQACY